MKNVFLITALYAVSSLALASDPSLSNPNATTAPITEIYGHPAHEPGVLLKWSVYKPTGIGPWPAVLVIHAGGFKDGSRNDIGVQICAQDLANAGFLALAISYRLAPPGHIEGQVQAGDDGRYPKQSDDVALAVHQARIDPRCNGLVGAVGGSAGGTHAAVAAATGTAGDDRLDVAVCLSGAYNFSDFRKDPRDEFENDITNYVGARDPVTLLKDSPITIVDATVAPLFLINTEHDVGMPVVQIDDMVATLQAIGVTNSDSVTLSGNLHAFDYWSRIKTQAIAFLTTGFTSASGLAVPGK